MKNLTFRQIVFLVTCFILAIVLAFFPQETVSENEVFFLVFLAFPLILFTIDPKRLKK